MKWIKSLDEKPKSGVDVHVVLHGGIRSVAKYWDVTQQWLSGDPNVSAQDIVVKWKYEQANLTNTTNKEEEKNSAGD